MSTTLTATLATALLTDLDSDTLIDPGETVTTTVTITNTTAEDALSVAFDENLSGMTLVANSVNVSPLAFDDAGYNAVGNVSLSIAAGSGVLTNDVEFLGATIGTNAGTDTVIQTTGVIATSQGGSVNLAADGSFTYTPAANFTGTDTFSYTLVDQGGLTGSGTASVTVGPLVWFIDNTAAAGGDGSQAHPFNSLAAFNAVNDGGAGHPGNNDVIYLRQGTGTYSESAGINLKDGQQLIGQGQDLTVTPTGGGGPVTIETGSAGQTPTISITGAGEHGIDLASGNTVKGLDVATTLGNQTAIDDGGVNVGTATISDVDISGAGKAFDVDQGGTLAVTIDSLSSTGSTSEGVDLENVGGSFAVSNGTISGTTGVAFNVVGGTLSSTYSGNMNYSSDTSMVNISGGHSGGTITFDTGTLTATNGGGLRFDDADGTYNFNGTTTLNGGDAEIQVLNGSSGTFGFSSGTSITNPNANTFVLEDSNANITYSGGIIDNSGPTSIQINNHDAGTITFQTGAIALTGPGIIVSNSNGGTINFNGQVTLNTGTVTAVDLGTNNTGGTVNFNSTGNGLDITTTSGTGFLATGGGTVSVQGSGNTISSTSGTALNIANTTIGGSGVTFQAIDHNGNNTAISLNNTGSGAFTVTGTGTTAGSGGTIQNIVGSDAVSLNNTDGLVTLKNMIIQDITASTDATDAVDTRSGIDAIQGQAVNAGLTVDNVTIQRISDSGINGSVGGAGAPSATSFNGLTVTNSTIANTGRFNVANKADATNEAAVFVYGLKGTVSVTNNTFHDDPSGLLITTATSGTLDMTVTGNSFTTMFKDIGTLEEGLYGISVVQEGSLSSIVRIGDKDDADAGLGNTFTNGGSRGAIRVITDTGSTGTMKAEINRNTSTVTDHTSAGTSGGSTSYNFPQGGVLMRALGSGNYEGLFGHNTLDQVMHADGGLGQLTLQTENGTSEFIVTGNTFTLPWDMPVQIISQAAGTTSAVQLTGNSYVGGTVGDASTDVGGPSPYEPVYAQARNGGRLDLTIQNETTPFPANDGSSGFSHAFYAQTTTSGDTLNLFLQNTKAVTGYELNRPGFAGGSNS